MVIRNSTVRTIRPAITKTSVEICMEFSLVHRSRLAAADGTVRPFLILIGYQGTRGIQVVQFFPQAHVCDPLFVADHNHFCAFRDGQTALAAYSDAAPDALLRKNHLARAALAYSAANLTEHP